MEPYIIRECKDAEQAMEEQMRANKYAGIRQDEYNKPLVLGEASEQAFARLRHMGSDME